MSDIKWEAISIDPKRFVYQLTVKFPNNKHSGVEFNTAKRKVIEQLTELKLSFFLDSRTYCFEELKFIVFTLISPQEIQPLSLISLANKLKYYKTSFSKKSVSYLEFAEC